MRNGKIVEIGENLSVDSDEALFDASGLQVFPGLVDAHCHTGLNNDGFEAVKDKLAAAIAAERFKVWRERKKEAAA